MGQQQLLLVILVTIIVGIATVVAINTFGSAADSANVDAARQDLNSMAAAAQGYFMKPSAMGGGSQSFTGIDFNNMGGVACNSISSDGNKCQNENGVYEINTADDTQLIIDGTPLSAGGLVSVTINEDDSDMGNYSPDGSEITPISE